MQCPLCGAELSDGSKFCGYCGWEAINQDSVQAQSAPDSVTSDSGSAVPETHASDNTPESPKPEAVSSAASSDIPVSPSKSLQPAITQPVIAPVRADNATKQNNRSLRAIIPIISVTFALALIISGITMLHVYRGGIFHNKYKPDSTVSVTPSDAGSSEESETGSDEAESASSGTIEIPKHSQIVTVKSSGSKATLTMEEYDVNTGKWKKLLTANGYLGKNGVTNEKIEGDKSTPKGTFNILFVFGISEPDTKLTYKKVTSDTVWVDDPFSEYYNTWQDSEPYDKDWSSSEIMKSQITRKKVTYRIAFDFNGNCLSKGSAEPGRGSAIFLEGVGSEGKMQPGYGEISISENAMKKLLKYLDSSKNPQIIIK